MKRTEFESARDVLDEFTQQGLAPTFCHVPFASLILEPDGRVGSCRVKGNEYSVGHLSTQTLDEIWNGPMLRQWRREFLSGQPMMCKKETRHQRCNTCPTYNSVLPEVELKEVQTRKPLRLSLNLNGKCNLECQMCHIWQEPNGMYDLNGWWEQIQDWIAEAQEIEMLSGEPFIQKDTYRLIDLISQKNPECRWSITTNSHWKFTSKIAESLDKIRFKNLIVSIDSLKPAVYTQIRKKGDLRVVLENLDQLVKYEQSRKERGLPSLNLCLNFVVQKDNWSEIGPFQDFAAERGLEMSFIFLYLPAQHSLLNLQESERESILDYYLQTMNREHLQRSRRIFLPLLDSLPALARSHFLLKLKEVLQ